LSLLTKRWQDALDGHGQIVQIIGEAGIGKSRLVLRFHELIAGTPHTWVEGAAAPFFQDTPFYLVSQILDDLLGPAVLEQERPSNLESRLSLAGLKPAEAVPLIAPLLNLALPTTYPASPLSPEQPRRSLMTTLVGWVLSASRAHPHLHCDRGFAVGGPLDVGGDSAAC
jgi:predicted ATPase